MATGKNKKLLTITIHIAVWACFFLLPIVFFPRSKDPDYHISEAFRWMLICINLYLVCFYYLNTQVLIPKLLAKQKWMWYILAIVGCLILFMYLPRLFEEAIKAELPEKSRFRRMLQRRSIIPNPFSGSNAVFFLVFTIGTCFKVIQQWLGAEQTKKEVEHEKLNTELSFLKSQINPHFLFNTLNNIYSLAVAKSDATAGAVMKLSSIMRYVLSETKHHLVPLDKEIAFINDFINLQQVRLTEKVKVNFTVEGETEGQQIAPLIFIPFVENAFKFGISTKENSIITIAVRVVNSEIHLTVDNPIVSQQTQLNENTGIGINNTKRRLELLYPERHTLEIKSATNHFNVHLTLKK